MVIDYHPSFLGCLLLSLQYGLPKVSRCKLPVGFAPQKVVNPPLSACRILIKGAKPLGGFAPQKRCKPPT